MRPNAEAPGFREIGKRLSNWGRWGAEDRIGTLNHITPERLVAAGGEIRSGRLVPLGLSVRSAGVQPTPNPSGRINPVHLISMSPADFQDPARDGVFGVDDYIFMPLQSVTQWDGLGHIGYDELFYNGVPASSITTRRGSTELSIDQIARRGIAGRGVLLDIARLRGVDRLAAGEDITPEDLQAAEARQGVEVGPGDIVLVRTGWLQTFFAESANAYWNGSPGLTLDCAGWLHRRDASAVASDNWGVECFQPNATRHPLPFHCVAIRDMGLTLGEIFVLDELGEACEQAGRWSFFFTAPPLLVEGGVGSPITPLAIL